MKCRIPLHGGVTCCNFEITLMSIYAVPPLLSAFVLFALFLMGILKAKTSRANILFAFICLLGCFLNADKAILTGAINPHVALRLSRIDHAFLAFVIPFYLHFSVLTTGYRKWMPFVKAGYVIALLFIPLTQHPLYLLGVHRFFFGFFALAGPLFYIFGMFSSASVILSISLLVKNLKEERVAIKRTRVKYILLSFGLGAIVTHFDIIIMMGYQLYPLGNFAFAPMCLLAYAIFKHDVMEWTIFLNKGTVFLALFFMSLGFFLGSAALLRHLLGESFDRDIIYVVSMVVTFILIYVSSQKVYSSITQFVEQEFLLHRKALRSLSSEILTLLKTDEITRRVTYSLSQTFGLSHCQIKTVPRIDSGEENPVLAEHDPFWQSGYRLALPVPSKSKPSYLLLGEKQSMSLYTEEETELLMMLANNIALAFDNAHAYKRLQDFSLSLEQLVSERTRALIQSESLAAVGRLAAGVAHELNNPLASVMSTLEYQIDHLKDDEDLREDLTFSLTELRRARDIVKSLLDASRQKDESKELVDIHTPIENALKVLHNQHKNKNITIERKFHAPQSLIEGNTPRLCQVFINMIKNAIDAIGEKGGSIIIETANNVPPGQNENPPNLFSGEVVCRVTDSGEGIEEQHLPDVLKPFFTTKPPGKGLGLGLFIAHEIVKDHNGSIHLESMRGKGTTVTLTFPSPRR